MFPPTGEVFLLDSALADGRLGRWSFSGGEPAARLSGRRRDGAASAQDLRSMDLELTVWREPDGTRPDGGRRLLLAGDPFEALRALRAAYGPSQFPDTGEPDPAPFAGGLVGWFGYGTAWATERLPRRPDRAEPIAPDLLFLIVDDVLRHDHATGTTTVSVTGRGRDASAADRDLEDRASAWKTRLESFAAGAARTSASGGDHDGTMPPDDRKPSGPAPAPDLAGISATCDEPAYRDAVARCRGHIRAGDAFEICLTQQMAAPLTADPWLLYQALRTVNPAPFAAFLRCGDVTVAGASPERFLSLDRDGRLESRPIKGTRPRGAEPRRGRPAAPRTGRRRPRTAPKT